MEVQYWPVSVHCDRQSTAVAREDIAFSCTIVGAINSYNFLSLTFSCCISMESALFDYSVANAFLPDRSNSSKCARTDLILHASALQTDFPATGCLDRSENVDVRTLVTNRTMTDPEIMKIYKHEQDLIRKNVIWMK